MKKILVVDDEQDIKSLFEQRFRREIKEQTYVFAFAFSGEEAIVYLDQNPHEAILILSDINMPGMSGLELLRRIKEKYEVPPPFVMMITAYTDAHNREQAIARGADDFVSKPIDFASLKEKLQSIFL